MEQSGDSSQYYLTELSTRLRDVEERMKITREKTQILSKNFVELKQKTDVDLKNIKQRMIKIEDDIEKLKSASNFLIKETGKYAKKDELISIERMLKNFQPLEFARIKDVEELFNLKTNKQKNINTKNK